uniref:GH140 n=1 Tax=uncultured Armatimonadetes bacterium TaxID=157466 RepID=A0A6J4IMQ9_9BACT|nr:GH140 [uncultured Armatimonadetes bacterium]
MQHSARSGATGPSGARGSGAAGSAALRVSANGRHLVRPDGAPFFWLGDTAWLLFQMTTREDADLYLKTRARQGFTVIQAALVMGEERVGGTLRPNVFGKLAFQGGDPARPDVTPGATPKPSTHYDYWDHADYIVERAGAHGLTLGLLPLFVGYRGDGYRYLTPDNASDYGRFLGRRYRDKSHVFWILGGDNTPDTEPKRAVWERMARGIAVGASGSEDYGRTLMTYHINGGASSSQWFHTAPWLDFNMTQVWGSEKDIYPAVARDYGLAPVKPCGLGEGSYENGPQYPTRPIDALKVRRQAYWSYLAGGYHTYGNTDTWNFGSYKPEASQDWKAALRSPGAASLSVLARLFRTLEWWKLSPEPTAIAGGAGSPGELSVAMRSAEGDRMLAYLPAPSTISLRLDRITASRAARATWIDPRTGARSAVGAFPTAAPHAFTTPQGWPDALLLVQAQGQRDRD